MQVGRWHRRHRFWPASTAADGLCHTNICPLVLHLRADSPMDAGLGDSVALSGCAVLPSTASCCRQLHWLMPCVALEVHPWLPRVVRAAGVLDFLVGWMLGDPACSLSAKNVAEAEIVDPRPITHIAELATQPRVCLQVRRGAACEVGVVHASCSAPISPASNAASLQPASACLLPVNICILLPVAQEHGDLPKDITRLFADSLFKLDMSFVPQVAEQGQA